jgi:hypothetical protein
MATKGLNSPFNICFATVKTSTISAAGVVTPGPDIQYYFQSSRMYQDATVATRTGITLVDGDKWQGEEPLIKIDQMILSRKLVRLVGEYTATNGTNKNVSFVAVRTKVGDLLSDDKTKNLTDLNYVNSKGTVVGKFFNVHTATRNKFA